MCTRRIRDSWLGIQHTEDACATGETAYKPVHHVAEGADGCTQQEHILGDRDQYTQAQAMVHYDNAAYPYYEDSDNVNPHDPHPSPPARPPHPTHPPAPHPAPPRRNPGTLTLT